MKVTLLVILNSTLSTLTSECQVKTNVTNHIFQVEILFSVCKILV